MSNELSPGVPMSPEVEERTIEDAERRELLFNHRGGLSIYQHWFRSTNTVRMTLIEEGFDDREFPIPNGRVLDAQDHPEYYAALAKRGRGITRPYQASDGA